MRWRVGFLAVAVAAMVTVPPPVHAAQGPTDETGDTRIVRRTDPTCPLDAECMGFVVRCPDTGRPARGYLAIQELDGARGMVVLHAGTLGTRYWASTPASQQALQDLHAAGLSTVQIRWQHGWVTNHEGLPGPRALACRPGTVLAWIHDELYAPLDLPAARGTCGFCFTGSSAGAAAGAYALTFYGADAFLDAVVLSSGPPFSDLAAACLPEYGASELLKQPAAAAAVDSLYGGPLPGPCVTRDEAWANRWHRDSLHGAGGQWNPASRVHLVVGESDTSGAVAHALHFAALLEAEGADIQVASIPGMGHALRNNPDGLEAVVGALTRTSGAPRGT